MTEETQTNENTQAQEANEATVAEQVSVYEKAAEMYRGGDKEGALNHIKENLGEEAAKDAEQVMEEADKVQAASDSEGSEPEDAKEQ